MSTTPPSLRDVQRWMRWAITDPRGVGGALADPAPVGLEPAARYRSPETGGDAWITAATPAERVARLDVYAEGYFQRVTEALAEDYPALGRALGQAGFLKLAADYLKHWPTRSYTLAEAGRHLPDFLAGYPLTQDVPWLPDLARLEWALVLAAHADDTPPLDPTALQAVPEAAWPQARFAVELSVQVLPCAWPVHTLWARREDADFAGAVAALTPAPTALLVRRVHGEGTVSPLDPAQAAALQATLDGHPLEAICAQAEAHGAGTAADDVMGWFGTWLAEGIIASIQWSQKGTVPPAAATPDLEDGQ